MRGMVSPHFSHPIYSVGGSGHVYCVVLGRPPQRTLQYVCGGLRGTRLRVTRLVFTAKLRDLKPIRLRKKMDPVKFLREADSTSSSEDEGL